MGGGARARLGAGGGHADRARGGAGRSRVVRGVRGAPGVRACARAGAMVAPSVNVFQYSCTPAVVGALETVPKAYPERATAEPVGL